MHRILTLLMLCLSLFSQASVAQSPEATPFLPESLVGSESPFVIGADGRSWYTHKPPVFPESTVGFLNYRRPNGETVHSCAGALIHRRIFLTAASCVYFGTPHKLFDYRNLGPHDARPFVHFGFDGFNSLTAEVSFSIKGFGDQYAHIEGNWALVVLSYDVSKTRGHLGVISYNAPVPSQTITLWGGYYTPGNFFKSQGQLISNTASLSYLLTDTTPKDLGAAIVSDGRYAVGTLGLSAQSPDEGPCTVKGKCDVSTNAYTWIPYYRDLVALF